MSEAMVPIIIVPVVFFSFIWLVKIISDNAVRRKIIDKGLVDENIKYLYLSDTGTGVPSSLKWGLVLVAVGAAFLVGQLMPFEFKDEFTVSAMLIFGGLALIAYYFIGKKLYSQDSSQMS